MLRVRCCVADSSLACIRLRRVVEHSEWQCRLLMSRDLLSVKIRRIRVIRVPSFLTGQPHACLIKRWHWFTSAVVPFLSTPCHPVVPVKICFSPCIHTNLSMEISLLMRFAKKNLSIILVIVLTLLLVATVIWVFDKRIESIEKENSFQSVTNKN